MPTQVNIEFFMIGKTAVNKKEVQRWMNHIGADEFELPSEEILSNPAAVVALAAKRCYMSFEVGLNPNITRVRKDYVDYFDNIMKSGHGSVLEHSVFNIAIEGVSRVFTAEANRHRAGVGISEGSLRFIRFGENIPYWEPDSIKGPDTERVNSDMDLGYYGTTTDDGYAGGFDFEKLEEDVENNDDLTLDERKHWSRIVVKEAFAEQERAYSALAALWAKELAEDSKFKNKKQITSMMRRIVGLGVATGGVWSGNIRALRHIFAMRASEHAEEEMIHVFSRMVKFMADQEPLLFGDFYQDDKGFWRPKYVKV